MEIAWLLPTDRGICPQAEIQSIVGPSLPARARVPFLQRVALLGSWQAVGGGPKPGTTRWQVCTAGPSGTVCSLQMPMAVPDTYMRSVRNVPEIFETIKNAGVPDRFTHPFLRQLGFTSSNDRAVISLMKALRFLDDNSVPTGRYRRFRDRAASGTVMAEALREAYSDLFTINESAQEMSSTSLTGSFKRITGAGDAVAKKMAATFKALAGLADWTASSVTVQPTDEEAGEPVAAEPPPLAQPDLDGQPPLMPALHHDVHIHLPVSTDVKVYDAIFRSLREHFR
jgi:Family of unknown function (DUF5343)